MLEAHIGLTPEMGKWIGWRERFFASQKDEGIDQNGSRALTKTLRKLQLSAGMPDEISQTEAHTEKEHAKKPRDVNATGLMVVGLFKLTKAAFFTAVGVVAFHLVHANLGNVVDRVISYLRIDSEGRLASFLMDRVDLIGHHQLRQAGLFSLLYAVICVVEGVGLIRHKSWAEYFTVVLTALGLPWEIYELVHKFEPYKIGLMAANVAILLYLLWVLKKKRERVRVE
jgi:uncharacterized membrane protein (DUF2068 family)